MSKVNISFIFLILSMFLFGQSEDSKNKAYEFAMEAIQRMNAGAYNDAIELFTKSKELDPSNINYPYEIALVHYNQKNYKKTIKMLKKLVNHADVSVEIYQLLGNSYDLINKSMKAIKTYKKGLKIFPNSGKLYLELGIVEYFNDNLNSAIDYWENGIEKDPSFSSNYYWLGKVFSMTSERIWAIIYGELFIILERNSNRTAEMSRILYDTYNNSINVSSDSSINISLTKNTFFPSSVDFQIPFEMSYEMTIGISWSSDLISDDGLISIKSINDIRSNFIRNWYEQKHNDKYPNVLFRYQKKLLNAGYFECYNYWHLMQGDSEEFETWHSQNIDSFENFINWFNENPLTLEGNIIIRNRF